MIERRGKPIEDLTLKQQLRAMGEDALSSLEVENPERERGKRVEELMKNLAATEQVFLEGYQKVGTNGVGADMTPDAVAVIGAMNNGSLPKVLELPRVRSGPSLFVRLNGEVRVDEKFSIDRMPVSVPQNVYQLEGLVGVSVKLQ